MVKQVKEGSLTNHFQELRFEMDQLVANQNVPGISAIVLQDGKIIFQHFCGLLDVESKVQLSEESLFRVYSMTKPITAVAILMHVEEGKLDLDDPVARYFPEWNQLSAYEDGQQVPAKEMKIHHLLTHTSRIKLWILREHVRLIKRIEMRD